MNESQAIAHILTETKLDTGLIVSAFHHELRKHLRIARQSRQIMTPRRRAQLIESISQRFGDITPARAFESFKFGSGQGETEDYLVTFTPRHVVAFLKGHTTGHALMVLAVLDRSGWRNQHPRGIPIGTTTTTVRQ